MKKIYYKFEKIVYLIKKSFYFAWHRHHLLIPPKALKKYIKSFFNVLKRNGTTGNLVMNQNLYLKWIEENERQIEHKELKYKPLISIVIPVYNVKKEYLKDCIDSIINQTYQNFEICIADDNSTNIETKECLKEYENNSKIKIIYRKENGHISECMNTALSLASGEYVSFLDNDDVLSKEALYLMVEKLNEEKYDLIYSDEDKLDMKGKRCNPHFKPDYSPDTLMGVNYICHFTMIKREIVADLGGFKSEYNGSQDYDLFLRVIEKTNKIGHVDKILYHWRESDTSTAGYLGNKSYVHEASIKALRDHFKRQNIEAEVKMNPNVSTYLVKYKHKNPLVSIIIPTKDKVEYIKKCVNSLYNKNTYKNFEIIIVDNNSVINKTKEFFEEYKQKYSNFKVVEVKTEFNYSHINNEGIKEAKGEYILLLNNDTEVITEDFLDWMVGYASQKHVGAVGIKLLYKDKKIQHAGVVLGYGGVAGHIYVTGYHNDTGIYGRLQMPYNYTAVTAACLMITREKYNEVGGLDENLKVALNDVDFCLKLLNKGYYNVLLPHITMYHYESRSRGYEDTKEKDERFKSEKEYMIKKWGKTLERDKFFNKNNL